LYFFEMGDRCGDISVNNAGGLSCWRMARKSWKANCGVWQSISSRDDIWLGSARRGEAGLGLARLGSARQGFSRQSSWGEAGRGEVPQGRV